jgi:hypothetical protein
MKRTEYGAALDQWVAAQKRIEAAEETFRATLLDGMFPPETEEEPSASPSPISHNTPPKQPQKK